MAKYRASEKSESVNKELDRLLLQLVGNDWGRVKCIENGICVFCMDPVELKTEADWNEYRISGICPKCWEDQFEFVEECKSDE
jgi:hypothetical protein